MSLIRWDEVGIDVPRPGWSGRRRALLRAWLTVFGLAIFAIALLVVGQAAVLLVWAASLPAPR